MDRTRSWNTGDTIALIVILSSTEGEVCAQVLQGSGCASLKCTTLGPTVICQEFIEPFDHGDATILVALTNGLAP